MLLIISVAQLPSPVWRRVGDEAIEK